MTIEELERLDTTPYDYVEVIDVIAHGFNELEGYQYDVPLRFIGKDDNNNVALMSGIAALFILLTKIERKL